MYGHRYGTVSSGITKAMNRERAARRTNDARYLRNSYTLTLTTGAVLTGQASIDGYAMGKDEFRAYVNGLSDATHATAAVLFGETEIAVRIIASL